MPEIIVKLGDNIVNRYFIHKDEITVGRSPDNDIAIENLAVSRRHSTITASEGRYFIEDNDSANGTYVNGVRVTRTELLDKDVITIGKHKLHFHHREAAEPPPVGAVADYAQATMLVSPERPGTGRLRVIQGKQENQVFKLDKAETRIGRAPDNEIQLNDWFVSKHHAAILRKGLVYVVRDLASWRHTYVNGAVIQEQVLKPGDMIQFGTKVSVIFEGEGAAEEVAVGSGRSPQELGEPADIGPSPEAAAGAGAERRLKGEDLFAGLEKPAAVAVTPRPEPVAVEDEFPPEASPGAETPAPSEPPGPEFQLSETLGPPPREPEPAAPSPRPGEAAASGATAENPEVQMWLKALSNPSPAIRRQAQRRLKALTGKDYDVQ